MNNKYDIDNIQPMNKLSKDIINVYTDGSCSKSGKITLCGYGIYFPDNELLNVSEQMVIEPLTNQRAELYAIFQALKLVSDNYNFKKLIVYSDSEYSIKSVTVWINSWKKNGWVSSKKEPVKNQDIIKLIDELLVLNKGKILFKHVKAHTGKLDTDSINNDIADGLAKAGALKLDKIVIG
jgi:ribonuclease HI